MTDAELREVTIKTLGALRHRISLVAHGPESEAAWNDLQSADWLIEKIRETKAALTERSAVDAILEHMNPLFKRLGVLEGLVKMITTMHPNLIDGSEQPAHDSVVVDDLRRLLKIVSEMEIENENNKSQ